MSLGKNEVKIIGPCSKYVDGQGWTTEVPEKLLNDQGFYKKEDKPMTNKEWLATLPSDKLVEVILDALPRLGRSSTQSSTYIKDWLDLTHDSNDLIYHYLGEL